PPKPTPRKQTPAKNKPVEDPPARRPPSSASQPADPEPSFVGALFGRVKSVLPGGTLVLKSGEKLHLLGVSCPAPGQPMAEAAARLIREQTRGSDIRLGWDMSARSAARRDARGCLLA